MRPFQVKKAGGEMEQLFCDMKDSGWRLSCLLA